MTVCRLRANAFKKDVVTLVLKDLNIISKPNSLLYDVIYSGEIFPRIKLRSDWSHQ